MKSFAGSNLSSLSRAFLSRGAVPSHVAATVGGVGLGFHLACGSAAISLWLMGPLVVYATWVIHSLLFSRATGEDCEEVVLRDGFTYLPFILIPVFRLLPIPWLSLSRQEEAVTVFAVSLMFVGKATLTTRDFPRLLDRVWRWGSPWSLVVAGIAIAYVVSFARLSYFQFASYDNGSSFYDLARYDQAAWNTIHGRLLMFTDSDGHTGRTMCRLGTHVDLIHVFFSLFYLLHSSPVTLLTLQSLVIGLATWPLYRFTKKVTDSDTMAFAVCLAFLMHPGIQQGNLAQFHAVCAAPLCLFALFYTLEAKRWPAFWILLAFTLICKENLALTTCAVGFWLFIKGERRVGAVTCLVSALWFYLCMQVLIPHFSGLPQSEHFKKFYDEAGGSLGGIASQMGRHPWEAAVLMFTDVKMAYLDKLLAPFGYLPLLAPITLAIALPELIINLLSDSPHMHSLSEHYNFVTVPLLCLVTVYAGHGVRRRLLHWRFRSEMAESLRKGTGHPDYFEEAVASRVTNVRFVVGLFIASLTLGMSRTESYWPWDVSLYGLLNWRPTSHFLVGEQVMHSIPPHASVSATTPLLSHLSHRESLYMVPYVGNAEYVLCDIGEVAAVGVGTESPFEFITRMKEDRLYKKIAEADGIFLWERKPYSRPGRPQLVFDFSKGLSLLGGAETLSDPAVSAGLRALQDVRPARVRFLRTGDIQKKNAEVRGQTLIVVTPDDLVSQSNHLRSLRGLLHAAASQSLEGYFIRSQLVNGYPCLVVISRSRLGLAYALFSLVNELSGNEKALRRAWDLAESPHLGLRLLSTPFASDEYYNDPDTALRYGFNAVMIPPWPELVTYWRFDHRVYGGKANALSLASVREQQARARSITRRAKALHLRIVTMGDVYLFPQSVFTLYGSQLRHQEALTRDPYRVCAGQSLPRRLLAVAFEELLDTFPEIDYVMVRTGENYAVHSLRGSAPSCGRCELCQRIGYVDSLRQTINLVRHLIVDVHHRKYIHRAWDLGTDGFHANPQVYESILAGLDKSPGLTISLKETETDFWRFNRLNLNVGRGSIPQMLEFQCAREYEGKGATVNYLGDIFARGDPYTFPQRGLVFAHSVGVNSGWAWGKGGGWGGPQVKSDLWIDANVYALGRLMWDPFLSPAELARRWATATFGPKAAPTVTRILMESADAEVHSRYFAPVAAKLSPWEPPMTWTRDDIIRGMVPLQSIYRACSSPTEFDAIILNQGEASRMADSFVTRFRRVMPSIPDRVTALKAYHSLLYQRSLYRVRKNYVCGTLYYLAWAESGGKDQDARTAASSYLSQWRADWTSYQKEIPKLSWAASLYRSVGMKRDCEYALEVLKNPYAREGRKPNVFTPHMGRSKRGDLGPSRL